MPDPQPWGRFATLGLAAVVLLAGQTIGLAAIVWWYGLPLGRLPALEADGIAVTILIFVSTPIEIVMLALLAQRSGMRASAYLGWRLPRRADVIIGIAAVIGFVVLADAISWLAGRSLVTAFQSDIYTTAAAQGWLVPLWVAIVVLTPVGEESLFRGFLFRGWFREPKDAWSAIALSALVFALMHVQYDWFVIAQVFGFGLLLGWMRWASGSTLLTILLHALINCEGMIETMLAR
jgi:membrane protease YdiL (CAAX protease family)